MYLTTGNRISKWILIFFTGLLFYSCEKGDVGTKGDTGDIGQTGATGLQGPKGETGVTGATGANGNQGTTGNAGTSRNTVTTFFSYTLPENTYQPDSSAFYKEAPYSFSGVLDVAGIAGLPVANYQETIKTGGVLVYFKRPEDTEDTYSLYSIRTYEFNRNGEPSKNSGDVWYRMLYRTLKRSSRLEIIYYINPVYEKPSLALIKKMGLASPVDIKVISIPAIATNSLKQQNIDLKNYLTVKNTLGLKD